MAKSSNSFMAALAERESANARASHGGAGEVAAARDAASTPGAASRSIPGEGGSSRKGNRGRPTTFNDDEERINRNFRISKLDAEALKLYVDTVSAESDMSEVVRKALRAYIPENVYATAESLLEMKNKVGLK